MARVPLSLEPSLRRSQLKLIKRGNSQHEFSSFTTAKAVHMYTQLLPGAFCSLSVSLFVFVRPTVHVDALAVSLLFLHLPMDSMGISSWYLAEFCTFSFSFTHPLDPQAFLWHILLSSLIRQSIRSFTHLALCRVSEFWRYCFSCLSRCVTETFCRRSAMHSQWAVYPVFSNCSNLFVCLFVVCWSSPIRKLSFSKFSPIHVSCSAQPCPFV